MGDLPTPVWSGSFRVFGIDVKCHVLDDGHRIIEADSVTALLAAMADPSELDDSSEAGMQDFARWQRGGSAHG